MKKQVNLLVGFPSIGKSYHIRQNGGFEKNFVVEHDEIIIDVAKENGFEYDDIFRVPGKFERLGSEHKKFGMLIKSPNWMDFQQTIYSKVLDAHIEIQSRFDERLKESSLQDKPVYVDITNLSRADRKEVIDKIIPQDKKNHFNLKAIVFKHGNLDNVKKLARLREQEIISKGGTKKIRDEVYEYMQNKFQEPSIEEGFDEIKTIDMSQVIKNIIREKQLELKISSNNKYDYEESFAY